MGRRDIKKRPVRILVIDDNVDHIELLSSVIEKYFAPVEIHTVESIGDALEFLEQTAYDVVFSECHLGKKSVLNEVPRLKKGAKGAPIVIVTGSGDEELAATAIKRGASEYIVKTRESLGRIPVIVKRYIEGGRPKEDGISLNEDILGEIEGLRAKAANLKKEMDSEGLKALIDKIDRLGELARRIR